MMEANYHTHTVRCNHAKGTEREYIEQALSRGLKTLGFSDHTPQLFDGYVSHFRMLPEQLEDYVTTVRGLKEEYAGRIEILIGLEAEYYPRYFDRLLNLYNGPLVKTISEKNFVNWLSVEIRLPPWYPYSAATEDRATVRTDLSAAPAET